jgi:malonyl-CoA/methylmalonyl-CoA synthetase
MAQLPLIEQARSHAERTAVIADDGIFSYGDILDASERVALRLLAGRSDLEETRVAFLIPPSFAHVAVQWGIWRAGGIAVPLAISHPAAELRYVIEDAAAAIVIANPEFEDVARKAIDEASCRLVSADEILSVRAAGSRTSASETAAEVAAGGLASGLPTTDMPAVAEGRRAMIVYTSGTTGRPKGVVTTHANIEAQVASMLTAWEWSAVDHILLVLPLHHVHGIINVVTCALWSGATCEMLPRFDAEETWARFIDSPLTVFMAVPTIYHRLIKAWEAAAPEKQREMSAACHRFRLMVSGSAALPVQVLERWRQISGHALLERYGMTEIGMGLSNPLHGERRPGHVGTPLPGVDVRLVGEGEIQVRGPGVFLEYWRRPEETRDAFQDGWFRTGDLAVVENGSYRILGRTSVDIIKSAGYKISALELEETLREHPDIEECAVVGVADLDRGEVVCAAVELREGASLTLEGLREWAQERLAPYKIPRALRVAPLPRNAMGKIQKNEVAALFATDPE